MGTEVNGQGSGRLDFKGLAEQLLSRSRELCAEWLPGGRVLGQEYTCANLHGGRGDSTKINIKTGMWKDFATGEAGGDLISLYAAIERIGQGEAFKTLNDRYAHNCAAISRATPSLDRGVQASSLIPPPRPITLSDMSVFNLGAPTRYWKYQDELGGVLFYRARYDPPEQRKQFRPWSWDSEAGRFISKAWPAPRPLYGLQHLKTRPTAPILLCEGEKDADAAGMFAGEKYICMTWGGAADYKHVDWAPIYGRNILLWPDADEPGKKAVREIAALLSAHCPSIKILAVNDINSGWGAADSDFTWDSFFAWAKPRAVLYGQEPPSVLIPEVIEDSPIVDEFELEIQPDTSELSAEPAGESEFSEPQKLGLICNKQGNPVCNANNVRRVLLSHSDFKDAIWFDEFHNKIFTTWGSLKPREWADTDDNNLMILLQDKLSLHSITESMVSAGMKSIAYRHIRNEPKDWMNSLTWDQIPRVESFLTRAFFCDDNDYTQAVSKNWFVSMVTRIMKPGSQVDTMLILEGGQGLGKSTAFQILGGNWYGEPSESVNSKDFFQSLQAKLVVEIGEMDSFSKAEVATIKRIITTRTDRFRPPYGRATIDYPRQCVFVGSTNEGTYLRDHTGARRFWPVKTRSVDLDLVRGEREQLFAEAVSLYKSGASWHIVPDSALHEQELRRQADEWEEKIAEYLIGKPEVRSVDIATDLLKIEIGRVDQIVRNRVARILTHLGWSVKISKDPLRKSCRVWKKD